MNDIPGFAFHAKPGFLCPIPLFPLSPLDFLPEHPGLNRQIQLYIKRDDLIHPNIQGNKWRKLRPTLELLSATARPGILTFGGPFSNHIQAVAQAGSLYGIKTVGILRGLASDLSNPTLQEAASAGMDLFPIPKKEYDAALNSPVVQEIIAKFPDYTLLPEGGATPQAVESCAEISREIIEQLGLSADKALFVAVPAGTGSTAAGILKGLKEPHTLLVFPAAAYGISPEAILQRSGKLDTFPRMDYLTAYLLGKFAAPDPRIWAFAEHFQQKFDITLDPIYTSRMMFGLFDLLEKGYFPTKSVIVAVHTGGLQGWRGIDLP